MSQEFKYLEEITPWLEGQLHGEALATFEKKRRSDPEFEQECQLMLALQSGLHRQRREAFRNFLTDIKAEVARENQEDQSAAGAKASLKLSSFSRRLLALAAALLPLLIACWWYVLGPGSGFGKGHSALNLVPETEQKGMAPAAQAEAERLFQEKNYVAAEPLFRAAMPEDQDAQYYLAVCLLHNSNAIWQRAKTREAIGFLEALQKTVKLPSRMLQIKAHLALAYIMDGRRDDAKSLLKQLREQSNNEFAEFAKKQLESV